MTGQTLYGRAAAGAGGTAHAGGVVMRFSHAGPIEAAVAHSLGTHLDLFQRRIVISPGSVSPISLVKGQHSAVLMVNSTSETLSRLRAP